MHDRPRALPHIVVMCVVAASACHDGTDDLGQVVPCGPNGSCPTGYSCVTTSNLCVRTGEVSPPDAAARDAAACASDAACIAQGPTCTDAGTTADDTGTLGCATVGALACGTTGDVDVCAEDPARGCLVWTLQGGVGGAGDCASAYVTCDPTGGPHCPAVTILHMPDSPTVFCTDETNVTACPAMGAPTYGQDGSYRR